MSLILKNIIPSSTWTTIRAYFNNLYVTIFNTSNVATGNSAIYLNTKSGILTFTSSCSAGATLDLTLTNSYIIPTTPIFFSLGYDTADQGLPVILYVTKGNGNAVIRIYNTALSDATNGNLVIDFQIMN